MQGFEDLGQSPPSTHGAGGQALRKPPPPFLGLKRQVNLLASLLFFISVHPVLPAFNYVGSLGSWNPREDICGLSDTDRMCRGEISKCVWRQVCYNPK